jgi:hypothetical protein
LFPGAHNLSFWNLFENTKYVYCLTIVIKQAEGNLQCMIYKKKIETKQKYVYLCNKMNTILHCRNNFKIKYQNRRMRQIDTDSTKLHRR